MSENDTIENQETPKVKKPVEMSLEDASSTKQLKDILAKKAREKLDIQELPGLHLLTKSKFYYNGTGEDKLLREHIASYNGYAILIKQEQIKEELNDKENIMFPALVLLSDLKKMKKVNGNIVRKLQPDSLHEYEIMSMLPGVIANIDKGV